MRSGAEAALDHVARMVEILEPAADLGARGRFRDKRDVESGEPPVLAVDEDVSIDPMLFDLCLRTAIGASTR